MIFNSFTFLVFFACILILHNMPFSWTVKKTILLIGSYVFYAAWNPPFVALLWLATIVDWHMAQGIAASDNQTRRRLYMLTSLVVNLGLLAYFKYGGFLLESFTALVNSLGVRYHPAPPDIILPIGISFYTFVTLSYTIDVYRREIEPAPNFLNFALLVTFFPHLVAGPILRAIDFLPQCETPRRANSQQMGWGLSLLLIGLFEKTVLADELLAPIADQVYNAASKAGFVDAWIGTLAFAGQIFFDFDGYSLAAIGVALCLGFVFPDNFRFPYAALWFSDFWQRWHISLSSWLRDYLYIPLGGNRKGEGRTYANLLMTMLIGGLWHGASWLFVLWGGLHGLYLVIERAIRSSLAKKHNDSAGKRAAGGFNVWLGAQITFLLVCLTWVFFRARHLDDALHLLKVMLTGGKGHMRLISQESLTVVALIGCLLGAHWMLRNSSLEDVAKRVPWWAHSMAIVLLLIALILVPGDNRAFIYFQF